MNNLFNFVPQSNLDAQSNLTEFIRRCKSELNVFGSNLNWSSWKWPGAGNFTKIGAHTATKNLNDQMDESFIDFAKAYFRYQQGHNPTGTKNELKALRAIEASLLKVSDTAEIKFISISVLDEAAQIIRDHYLSGAAYHGGRELERLAKFVSAKSLIPADLRHWKSPIPRKKDQIQTGAIAKARREEKLPSEVALNALAEIFANNPDDPKDKFTSSIFAMLMSAPSRISEILELPVDCEIEEVDSKGVLRYGWRFYAGKGFGAEIKWIPTEMVSVAKEAMRRIRELTEESRNLAKWIESNPIKFYRHSGCPDVTDDKLLTAVQVCQALGYVDDTKRQASSSLNSAGLENKDFTYTLNSLWKYVLSRQPIGFPFLNKEKNIKYSNALFSMRRNQLGIQRGTSRVLLWKVTNDIVNNDLSPRESLKSNHKSIFDRNNYVTSDNERIKLKSHQARHLLNTIAQRGGLSQKSIAHWSGRADPKQNRTYNHVSEYEMVERARELDTSLSLFGPEDDLDARIPVTIQEFNTLEKGAIHVSEFGFCSHDYLMSPCQKYRDCLNCNEHICIKGDQVKLERIQTKHRLVLEQYLAAEKAMVEGYSGADRWYESQKSSLENLEQLINVLENPKIENGALIKISSNKSFSPLRRALRSNLRVNENIDDLSLLGEISKALGGGFG